VWRVIQALALVLSLVLAACAPSNAPPSSIAPSDERLAPGPSPMPTTLATPTRTVHAAAVAPTTSAFEWPVFDGDPARSGNNLAEHQVGPQNVSRLAILWRQHLPMVADSAPVYRDGRLYLTLMDGSTVALDLQTGRVLWRATTKGPKFTTASPALDPSGRWVYAYGLDGFVHRYDTTTGQEGSGQGWPIRVTTWPQDEKGSSSLNIANGRLYVAISGYPSDGGHYAGHLVVIDLATAASTIFNTLCHDVTRLLTVESSQPTYCPYIHAGIWARQGAVVDPTTGDVFIATGDGPWNGTTNWGDSVLELSADGRTLLDSYTPTDQDGLNSTDTDFGSSAPALLPEQLTSTTPFLAVQGSKDGKLRLLNRRNLSGQGRPGHVGGELQMLDAPRGCSVRTAPAVWVSPNDETWIFVANDCGLAGLELVTNTKGQSRLVQKWIDGPGGSSPLLANGVLYVAHSSALEARDPRTGRILWRSSQLGDGGVIGPIHWQSPIIVDGRLIIADGAGDVIAFGLVRP
jgi:outer membrane protein assembly factor BamB